MSGSGISVAMCTYNGSPFLPAQLASIAGQTRLPDELVVCDDRSTDDTVAVLRSFAREAPFVVKLVENTGTLGSTKNFEEAMLLCGGPIIALCDQDDVWLPDKLESTAAVLASEPDAGAVCGDLEIVGRDLQPTGTSMKQGLHFTPADQALVERGNAVEVLVRNNFVTGTTLAFRASFVPDIAPIPESWVHDAWIGLMVALRSRIAFIDRPLVRYRQHGANQVGAASRPGLDVLRSSGQGNRQALQRDLERWKAALDRASPLGGHAVQVLAAKVDHAKARAQLPERRLARVPVAARELVRGNYGRYSAGARSFVKDLLVS